MDIDIGNRLLFLRTRASLSQRKLAKQAGISNATISMIESGRINPSIAILKKVLDGFPIGLSEFFDFEAEPDEPIVYRASNMTEIGKAGTSYKRLGRQDPRRALHMLHEHYQPGAHTGNAMLSHDGEECGIVVRGRIELTVDGKRYVLKAGDGYYFDSKRPHRFRNTGDEVCEIVSTCSKASL